MPARREPERIVSSVENMPRSWRRETKPHKFCPGCGHPIILKALGKPSMNWPSWTGSCTAAISAVPPQLGFLSMWTVSKPPRPDHPVIVGLKRARPEAIGIAYMGDGGGYAIGAQHLVNAAARDDKITIILCNNTVYAMTGGQLAPTTLPDQATETTPHGRDINLTGPPTLGPEMLPLPVPGPMWPGEPSSTIPS